MKKNFKNATKIAMNTGNHLKKKKMGKKMCKKKIS